MISLTSYRFQRSYVFLSGFVFVSVSASFVKPSVNSAAKKSKMRVLNDVCMVVHSDCNSFGNERETFIPRKSLNMKTVAIRKKYEGVSAFITAKHSKSYDWTNYGHWGEACILFSELANQHAAEIHAKLHSKKPLKLTNIVLPQINAPQRDCGLAKSHGIQALRGRGGSYSEVYVAFARAAVLPLQRAGIMFGNSTVSSRPSICFCRDVEPTVSRPSYIADYYNITREKKSVACFQSIIEVKPDKSHQVQAFRYSMEPKIRELLGTNILGMTNLDLHFNENQNLQKFITLITRRNGPVWSNRLYVASALKEVVHEANSRVGYNLYAFRDAGFAEDLGRVGSCYHINPQIRLWASSWLVLAPHGAHETNVVFMAEDSGGLVEGFACGHQSTSILDFAKYSMVAYRAARESGNGGRHNCHLNNHRKYLDKPRIIRFEHDTMLAMIKEAILNDSLTLKASSKKGKAN